MNIHPNYNEDPELPFGGALRNADGFKVPDLYFHKSEEQLLAHCRGLLLQVHSKPNGFEVPENYFDQLADTVMERISSETLSFLPATDGFTVPEGYFETFSDRIQSRLTSNVQSTQTRTVTFRKIWYWAAAACLFGVVGLFALKWSANQSGDQLLSACTEDELLEYVTTYADEFDEESLASLLEESDMDQLNIINELDESADELLIEYLE